MITLIILVFLLTIPLSVVFYNEVVVLEKIIIPAYVIVSEGKEIGLNPENDAFYFGAGPEGSTSIRNFEITNNFDEKIKVRIQAQGDFEDWIIISDNNFVLEKNESRKLEIKTIIPNNALVGEYNATITFVLLRTT